jgi:hypothetical protein
MRTDATDLHAGSTSASRGAGSGATGYEESGNAVEVQASRQGNDAGWLRENGLGLALALLFAFCLVGLVVSGHASTNEDRAHDGLPPLSVAEYVASPAFVAATFENWESEFLQMGVFVLLSAWLRQKGSAESRPLHEEEPQVFAPEQRPWPVRRGGIIRRLYEWSLAIAFFALFAVSFVAHLLGSVGAHNEQEVARGAAPVAIADYLGNAKFWFESFQNWQSEFLSLLAIVLLTIWLRQKDSPQSKPVEAPHHHTGH